jgi:glycosyltransferase involved in cell wall biosynthesis
MSIKLSIITINYNNAPGLQKTMESVFDQTSQEFEYIVVDGGSTDGSKEIIKQFERDIDKLNRNLPGKFAWISEKDNGIYNAMNKGIRMAKGEYCQFLNSGDALVSSDVTTRMLNNMPETSILYGNKLKVFSNGSIIRDKGPHEITMLTFYQGTINHCTAYIKRSLFDLYGMYDESLKIVSDWKFYVTAIALHNEKVEYRDIDVCLFDMTGISSSNKELDKKERRHVLLDILPLSVLIDYDRYAFTIAQTQRLKRYWFTRKLFWLTDRILFKFERLFRK